MWTGQYNPLHSFDALFSENLDHLESHSSGSRMEFPGGGYIELPGIEDIPEQNEQTEFHSDIFQDNLESKSSGSTRIELPGGGYVELPTGIDTATRELNMQQSRCHSDIFRDVDFRHQNTPAYHANQDVHAALFSKIQELEYRLAEKDHIICQQENKNAILCEHLNRLLQLSDERNVELYGLRYEANRAINELQTRIVQLTNQVQQLHDEVTEKDAECSEMHCQIKLVALQRSMLTKEREERIALEEKVKTLEKSTQDLLTKNSILEHELTVLPRMISKASPKTVVKAEVHTMDSKVSCSEPKDVRLEMAAEFCSQTVDEQKTFNTQNEDPERIEVLEIQSNVARDGKEDDSKKRNKPSSLRHWLKKKTPKNKKR